MATQERNAPGSDHPGEWFTRWINTTHGVAAIELVYCPFEDGQPQPCRTAVVWERGNTELIPGTEATRD